MKKVLIVDDTKNIRLLLTTCLELQGYEVKCAIDGEEAIHILEGEKIDLAFIDIKMPEISGTEVLRRIRKSGIETPVIIMTAFATVKNAVDCTKLGAVAYLQKPFTMEKIKGVIKEIEGNLSENIHNESIDKISELTEKGKIDEALRLTKSMLSKSPEDGRIYERLGYLYKLKGDISQSIKFYDISKILLK